MSTDIIYVLWLILYSCDTEKKLLTYWTITSIESVTHILPFIKEGQVDISAFN